MDAALGPDFNAVYFLIVLRAAVVFFLMRRIDRSPYGRALRAIREDAQVAQVAGKPVLRFKTQAFALSAAIAGLAGALYGHFTSYIAPDLFLPLITVYIFLAVASGGTGRPAGALVGAYMVMTLLESSRFFVESIPGVTAVQRAALKELLIAVALILVLRLKPRACCPNASRPRRINRGRVMTPLETCIAALRSPAPRHSSRRSTRRLAEVVGHKLFTLLYVAPNGKRVKRLYTNMPKEYPVGGYKDVKETTWHKRVVGQSAPGSATNEDIQWAFFDHELILSLGCESAMNMPVVYAGRLLGTMNLLDAAGHYKESDPRRASPSPRCWSGRSSTRSPPIRDEALHSHRHARCGKDGPPSAT